MSEILKSKHAFGSEANIQSAIDQGLIDAYDILFLKEGKLGWLDANKNLVMHETKKIEFVDSLPEIGESKVAYVFENRFYFWNGTKFVCSDSENGISENIVDEKINTAIKTALEEANSYTNDKFETVETVKYEISHKPIGTLVNYGEEEIRVMCPADTEWVKQNVGETGNANMYYMGFKAYAPEEAVSFKESENGVIVDEMFYFENNDFAGTDEFGRKYSIVWLPLASYDESSDTWTYFGKNSSSGKYVGWNYVVEWYNSNGIVIASDSIRINLSNEECHLSNEPYYINSAIETANAYTDGKIAEAIAIVEF